jgi:hypothetical protein
MDKRKYVCWWGVSLGLFGIGIFSAYLWGHVVSDFFWGMGVGVLFHTIGYDKGFNKAKERYGVANENKQ